ncbi:hypothetical protein SAMN05877753_110140 [Bacillus oleivorans]|uniref:Uncharacterized protein n=1 Tax=Bacillus oleivorans TaxID=1448271 RepID=A0A285D502_9BACI|nr:hypothetical protein [Bacillus oleivorans]SNX74891.1 hypothetical protein SAMN05877753_110140 [Bacillus oleivorans]
MKGWKQSLVPFLLVILVVFVLFDFGDGEIEYEFVSYENLPVEFQQKLRLGGPGGTGMFSYNGHTYAFIGTNSDEKVEIQFVGDSSDGIGHEVIYKVMKQESAHSEIIKGMHANLNLYIIRLKKDVGTPFGFREI